MAITLERIKTLEVSAASGLIMVGPSFYVIADDELSLLKFPAALDGKTELIRLFEGELPSEPKARKKVKPDFEALVELEPGGPILIVPSGSKPNRTRGAMMVHGEVREIDFSNLYSGLLKNFPELNIEGAVVTGSRLLLFQRGNGKLQQNGFVSLELSSVLNALSGGALTARSIVQVVNVSLGHLQGVPLSFTDAALESADKIWFTAAAEATENTYDDGEFAGAVLGALSSSGKIVFQEELACPSKPEGLCLDLKSKRFFVVTDSDDAGRKSELFVGDLPSPDLQL